MNVLRIIETHFLNQHDHMQDWEKETLTGLLAGCLPLMESLDKKVKKNPELGKSRPPGVRDKSKRALESAMWDPGDLQQLRGQINLHVSLLTAFISTLDRYIPAHLW